jgi:hypothetical protein
MRPSSLATVFGAGRALVGVALLAAPGPITRAWVGNDDTPALVLARCAGGRDLVIGAGAALAAARDRDTAPWLAAGALADLVDGISTLAAGDRIPRNGRLGTVALAGASAVLGAWLACVVE